MLRVAHHGSRWSSTKQFLSAVSPSYAVISCGEGNSYGHPHEETLEKLQEMNVKLFRTDLLGKVHMISDGENILFITDRAAGQEELFTAPLTT